MEDSLTWDQLLICKFKTDLFIKYSLLTLQSTKEFIQKIKTDQASSSASKEMFAHSKKSMSTMRKKTKGLLSLRLKVWNKYRESSRLGFLTLERSLKVRPILHQCFIFQSANRGNESPNRLLRMEAAWVLIWSAQASKFFLMEIL